MKGSSVISVLVLTIVSIHSARGIPIPARPDGFVFQTSSSSTPSAFLEAFIDPLCSDSADAWPVLTKVAHYFQNDLLFTVHPFPLPYHHNAFFACRALHIMDNLNNSLTIPLLELFFDTQSNFSTSWTMNEAPSSVVSRIVQLVMDNFGETLPSDFESRFQAGFENSNYDMATRISFKFGCARVVTGTPYFFVNGIPIYDADSSWDFFQWLDIIEPLLTGESKKHASA